MNDEKKKIRDEYTRAEAYCLNCQAELRVVPSDYALRTLFCNNPLCEFLGVIVLFGSDNPQVLDHESQEMENNRAELFNKSMVAVKKILVDLTDRRGLDQAWEDIGSDIQSEIEEAWAELIAETLGQPHD